jgi:uncharacterized membrane protein required for colicin V production
MTLAGIHFGIIDISLIVLCLLFAISGFKNGFVREILRIGSFVGAIIIAYFLANWVEDILVTTPLYTFLFTNLKDLIFTGNTLFDTVIDSSQPEALGYLTDGLTQLGLPSFLASPLANILITVNGTLGEALATLSAYFIVLILSYIAPFLVAWLLLAIIGGLLVKLFSRVDSLQFIDSVLGVGLGLARASILIAIAFVLVIPITFVVPSVNTFITSDLALNDNVFSIGKFIYTFIIELIGSFISL